MKEGQRERKRGSHTNERPMENTSRDGNKKGMVVSEKRRGSGGELQRLSEKALIKAYPIFHPSLPFDGYIFRVTELS